MNGETRGRWRLRGLAPLFVALAASSCQVAFRFCADDAGVTCDGGAADGGDAGRDAGDSGVDAGPDAGPDAGDSGMDAGLADGKACLTNDQCLNGQCLVRCCSTACAMQDADCAATACDDTGACLYTDAGTACGTILPVCTVGRLDFHACDGTGTCKESIAVCPGGFACNPDGTSCATQCGTGACPDMTFCDPAQSLCCPIFTGNAMHVDGINGSDTGCCGSVAQPCHTLTRTMQVVEAFGVPGFDLIVAGGLENADAGGLDWTTEESWPVRLRLGVSIVAPYVHFVPSSASPAFVVNDDSPADMATVGIFGQTCAPVFVGIDAKGLSRTTTIAIDDGASEDAGHNLPLSLQNVWLNATKVGLRVGPGGSVSVGNVTIGSGANSNSYCPGRTTVAVKGDTGILCAGTAAESANLSSPPSSYTLLAIDSQSNHDIDAEDHCQMSLGSVTLGDAPPYPGGVASCPPGKIDSTGLYAAGPSRLTFSALTAQCMVAWGAKLLGTDAGAPLVTATTGTFQNCGCAGVYLAGGAQLISNVSIHACQVGLQIDDDWRKIPGLFTPSSAYPYSYGAIYCNSSAEPSDLCRTNAGIDFLNTTSATTADAHGLQWDLWSDGGSTQVWACTDASFKSCTCQGAFCASDAGQALPDDADAVYLQGNSAAQPFDLRSGSAITYYGCN